MEHERKLMADQWMEISERILLEANVLLENEAREFHGVIQRPTATRTRLTAAVARWLDNEKRGHRR